MKGCFIFMKGYFIFNQWMMYMEYNIHMILPEITVKPVCNDHLYNKMYYLWFIQ